jgi:hypothetical protein
MVRELGEEGFGFVKDLGFLVEDLFVSLNELPRKIVTFFEKVWVNRYGGVMRR